MSRQHHAVLVLREDHASGAIGDWRTRFVGKDARAQILRQAHFLQVERQWNVGPDLQSVRCYPFRRLKGLDFDHVARAIRPNIDGLQSKASPGRRIHRGFQGWLVMAAFSKRHDALADADGFDRRKP
jgi:hypothetical protein